MSSRAVGYAYEPVEPAYDNNAAIEEIEFDATLANSVSLIGTAGRKPELKFLASGNKLAQMSIAIKDRKASEATWIEVEMWGPLAERAAESVDKGAQVAVQGRLKVDTWQDKLSGQTRKAYKVVANSLSRVRPWKGREAGMHLSPQADQETAAAAFQQQQRSEPAPAAVPATSASSQLNTLEERWMSFFEDPEAWEDQRGKKASGEAKPRAPDFRLKRGGKEAPGLWLDNRGTPAWVHSELQKLAAAGRVAAPPY